MTVFVFLLMVASFYTNFLFLLLVMACQRIFPQSTSFLSNLLWMICNSHQRDYDNMCYWGNEKVSTALAFIQMFFSSCTLGKYMYINSVDIVKLVLELCCLFTFVVGHKHFSVFNTSAPGNGTLPSFKQWKISILTLWVSIFTSMKSFQIGRSHRMSLCWECHGSLLLYVMKSLKYLLICYNLSK